MHKLLFLFFMLWLAFSNNAFSQNKFEKERRIKRGDIPSKALLFIDSLSSKKKLKWYKEEGLTTISIEAKFKYRKTKYSIEFDTLGNIEDVEIEAYWDDLEPVVINSITTQLEEDCSKHKIVKIQRQLTGTKNDLFSLFHDGVHSEQLKTKYELVVQCNELKEVHLFEYLFDENGLPLGKSKIIFKNSMHLEY